MTTYMLGFVTILDHEAYREYERRVGACVTRAGGRFLAADDNVDVMEGDWPYKRVVMIEFADREACVAWYQSDEYQELRRIRNSAARSTVMMLDGFDASAIGKLAGKTNEG